MAFSNLDINNDNVPLIDKPSKYAFDPDVYILKGNKGIFSDCVISENYIRLENNYINLSCFGKMDVFTIKNK